MMQSKRHYLPVALLVGASGGGTGFAMIPEFLFALVTFAAACVAGLCVASLFGRDGVKGWGIAFLAGILATFGASTSFGLFINPDLFIDAPAVVFLEIVEHPVTLIWWLATMGAAHLTSFRLRRLSKQ